MGKSVSPVDLTLTSRLKQLVDSAKNPMLVAAPMAGLFVLRWAAVLDAENASAAASDGRPFTPSLPPSLKAAAWRYPTVSQHIGPELQKYQVPTHVNYARYVQGVAPVIQECAHDHPAVFAQLTKLVRSVRFDSMRDSEAVATTIDALLKTTFVRRNRAAGEFETPAMVVDLMLDLVAPLPGELVYDPCFGFGDLLVEAGRRMREENAGDPDVGSLFGMERNPLAYAIGLCRTLMAGVSCPALVRDDDLERAELRAIAPEGFDCILAAPPWGHLLGGSSSEYAVRTHSIENLLLQHVMACLKPGGRAVVALPDTMLYGGGADGATREALVEQFRVDAVIALPERALAPRTDRAASLVVFRRIEPAGEIRFFKISRKTWDAEASRAAGESRRRAEDSQFESRSEGESRDDLRAGRLGPLRVMAEMARSNLEIGAENFIGGIEAWAVPIGKLRQLEFELLAKPAAAKELQVVLGQLESKIPGLKLLPLNRVATIFSGFQYDKGKVDSWRTHDTRRPLIRVGDIREPELRRPALVLTAEAEAQIAVGQRLQAGDILVSTSGTVGKVALVRDDSELIGAVPANSISVVRVNPSIYPAFMAALLMSPGYKSSYAAYARGAIIQHLSVKNLGNLPVPMVTGEMQAAAIRYVPDGGDALNMLIRLADGKADPVGEWLERPVIARSVLGKDAESDPIRSLSRVGEEILRLRSSRSYIVKGSESNELPGVARKWVLVAIGIGTALRDLETIPEGTPRLAALEFAREPIRVARRALSSESGGVVPRLLEFLAALDGLIDKAKTLAIGESKIRVGLSPKEIVAHVPTAIELSLENASRTAIRRIYVTTDPDVGRGEAGYIAEAGRASIPLVIDSGGKEDLFRLCVQWKGTRLDGGSFTGSEVVEISVLAVPPKAHRQALGPNPYITGSESVKPARQEMFFGRADIMARISRELTADGSRSVILLEGNRRTGKSSILWQLTPPDVLPGWVTVFCDIQGGSLEAKDLYRLLAKAIASTLNKTGVRTWFPGEPPAASGANYDVEFRRVLDRISHDEHPLEMFEIYLNEALSVAAPRRVLLMIDEFDEVYEGVQKGKTSAEFPRSLRYLLQRYSQLSVLITGSDRLSRAREEYFSALFGLGVPIRVSALSPGDARRLVVEPVAGRLEYQDSARDEIVSLCACRPFLIQRLCDRIFKTHAEAGRAIVLKSEVTESAKEMVKSNEYFKSLWKLDADTERQRLVLALCERHASDPDPVDLPFLSASMESYGIFVSKNSELGDDLEILARRELIDFDPSYRSGTYRIAVPLFGMWIRDGVDIDGVIARAREEAKEAQP